MDLREVKGCGCPFICYQTTNHPQIVNQYLFALEIKCGTDNPDIQQRVPKSLFFDPQEPVPSPLSPPQNVKGRALGVVVGDSTHVDPCNSWYFFLVLPRRHKD